MWVEKKLENKVAALREKSRHWLPLKHEELKPDIWLLRP
jgi:hypothetical protein